MKRIARTIAIALIVASAAAVPVAAAPVRVWENIELVAADNDNPVRLEAKVKDGYVYITLSRRAQVKIFTILGQTVSQAEWPAGTSRLRIDGRGSYILKAGDTTMRIPI